jgi:hypothetical protein
MKKLIFTNENCNDTKVGQAVQSENDRRTLQTALNNLCDWTEKWGMCFNVSKCKVMHFGRVNPNCKYTMNGVVLRL